MGGGHSNNKKAFTLIELLAIIVILAIIAVITVPIILNVIDNAKKGSVIDSAYGYKDAVQKFYVSKLYEDANFKFENGTYTVETLKTMGVSVDGTVPTDDSWVEITNNQVSDYSLKFDEWVVNYNNNNPEAIKNGTVESLFNENIKIKSYFVDKIEVYFDPTGNDTECSSSHYNADGKTGCMKWYAYSENEDGTINMILDHNSTKFIEWTSEDDYNKSYDAIGGAKSLGITYPDGIQGEDDYHGSGNWNKGPITLLNQLKIDSVNWTNSLIRKKSYGSYTNCNIMYKQDDEECHENYKISYFGYNARLITAQEIANLTNVNNMSGCGVGVWNEKNAKCDSEEFASKFSWLLDNVQDENPYGYWTASAYGHSELQAWGVSQWNCLDEAGHVFVGDYDYSYGLRPVITVDSSVLSGS